MKILQEFTVLLTIISLSCADKKPEKTQKAGKRDIAFGIQAIPGAAAVHTPLADGSTVYALGGTTGNGGFAVHPVQFLHHPHDPSATFTSPGFEAYPSAYGVYGSPHAIVATPYVGIQETIPKSVHQLDQGWKGIEYDHGSIKRGHEIAQTLSKSVIPQENVYEIARLPSFVPQHDFEHDKVASNVFNHNNLLVAYPSYGTTGFGGPHKGHISFPGMKGKENAPFSAPHQTVKAQIPWQPTSAPKGYSLETFHATPTPNQEHFGKGPSGHSNLAHFTHSSSGQGSLLVSSHNKFKHGHQAHLPNHKFQPIQTSGYGSTGHGSLQHAHQLAKNVNFPTSKRLTDNHHSKSSIAKTKHQTNHFHGSHIPPYHKSNDRSSYHSHKKPISLGGKNHHSSHLSPAHKINGPSFSYGPSGPSRVSSNHHSGEHSSSYDPSSYSSDFSSPHQKSFSSSEAGDDHSNSQHTGDKATSFQSFVIHNYEPHHSKKNSQYTATSHESEENVSSSKHSGELNF